MPQKGILFEYDWTKDQLVLILYDQSFKKHAEDIADALKHVEMKCDQQQLDMKHKKQLVDCKL